MGKGFIAISGQHLKSSSRCVVANAYSPCALSGKKTLWEDLSNAKSTSQDLVWCLCGDFNAIRNRSERKRVKERGVQASELNDFNSFIDSNLLMELPIVGKNFMWFKNDGSVKSRIDRVLVSEDWLRLWPMSKQYVLRWEVSDHCAIVVKSVEKDWDPKPFRTIDAWILERGFIRMVKNNWQSYSAHGNELIKLKEKLKLLKFDLKAWNKEVFGNLDTAKRKILQKIEVLDYLDCEGGLVEFDRWKRM